MRALILLLGLSLLSAAPSETYTGQLGPGDDRLQQGEYYDAYTLDVRAGQTIEVDMTSREFDTYLVLIAPSGADEQNDDYQGSLQRSYLRVRAEESGTWRVLATSYAGGETGRYQLSIGVDGSAETGATGKPEPRAQSAPSETAGRTAALGLGQEHDGRLEHGDSQLSSGEYADAITFQGQAGEPVLIEMTSTELDPYLIVRTPGGEQADNDDFEGDLTRSRIEMVMPETGTYTVQATSYAPGETGRYTLRITSEGAMQAAPLGYTRMVGLFVGISDYQGTANDLDYTAEDAVRIRQSLIDHAGMRAEDAILLTDAQATGANFRSAVHRLQRQADENTLFVLFFSGHGDQVARPGGPQPADPDALDETLELYDGPILDDELHAILAPIRSQQQLLVIDACFSGGLAKDLISVPGRMGLFSSEEDVLSWVASEFQAGGYLARFFSDALDQRAADEDRNGVVTTLELSTYLRDRYTAAISGGDGGLVIAGEAQRRHQVLVVDRGSIGPSTSLFALEGARIAQTGATRRSMKQ